LQGDGGTFRLRIATQKLELLTGTLIAEINSSYVAVVAGILLRVAPLELPQQSGLLFYFASTLETAASLCVVFMRSVRAGLELVAVVGALKTHAPLQTRVGIARSLVT
jgi:hypothetical protein